MSIWKAVRKDCKRYGLPVLATFMITRVFHCQVHVVGNLDDDRNMVQIGRWTSPNGHPKWVRSKANFGKELRIK